MTYTNFYVFEDFPKDAPRCSQSVKILHFFLSAVSGSATTRVAEAFVGSTLCLLQQGTGSPASMVNSGCCFINSSVAARGFRCRAPWKLRARSSPKKLDLHINMSKVRK